MPRVRPGQRPCTKCGVTPTVRPNGICRPCASDASKAKRVERPCTICGEATTSKYGAHQKCRMFEAEPEPDDGLGEGDWRFDPFRRVQIWVPKPLPEPEPEPQWPPFWDDSETAASLRIKALIDPHEEAA